MFPLICTAVLLCIPKLFRCLSSEELCSTKVCSGCIAGSLSCQEGGLSRLPDTLTSDITSIIFIGHTFLNHILTKENFSRYGLQAQQIQRLTLRNCGIEHLQPGAFQSLTSLTQLDLSQNRIRTIETSTFVGLKLEFLRLDENNNLHIAPGGFEGLNVASLSMNQCGFKTITYEDLYPLFRSQLLTNLQLSANRIETLDNRLESTFRGLESLAIDQNPFDCNCKLHWLVDLLQRRQSYFFNKHSDTNKLRQFGNTGMQHDAININQNGPLDGDTMKPVCQQPDRLKNKLIESLTANDFYCTVPKLQELAVDLSEFADLTRYSLQQSNVSDKEGETVKRMQVKLKCNIKGSPEMNLSWYKRIFLKSHGNLYETDKLVRLPNIKLISPGEMELLLTQPSLKYGDLSTESPITEELVCLASDTSGNTSAEIKITWPYNKNKHEENVNAVDQNDKKYPIARIAEPGHHVTSNENPIPSSTLHSQENIDWHIFDSNELEGFWFKERFSVVEMIGAVVGTFTITFALFVMICCLLRVHRHHRDFVRSKILLQQTTSYHHRSVPLTNPSVSQPTFTSGGYPASNVLLGSETYNPSGQNALNPNASSTYNMENGTASSDSHSSGQRPPFVTYALTKMIEPICSSIYSEAPTYDLPQLPPIQSPPSAPLPPIPVMKNMTSLDQFLRSSPSCNPSNVTSGIGSCSILHPMTTGNALNGPQIATLTRLDGSGPFCQMNLLGSASQHNLALSTNPLFGYINQQPTFKTQLQEAT